MHCRVCKKSVNQLFNMTCTKCFVPKPSIKPAPEIQEPDSVSVEEEVVEEEVDVNEEVGKEEESFSPFPRSVSDFKSSLEETE